MNAARKSTTPIEVKGRRLEPPESWNTFPALVTSRAHDLQADSLHLVFHLSARDSSRGLFFGEHEMLLYVPEGFDPPTDLRDAAMFICHRIFVGRALWQTQKGFTKLKAEYLKEAVGPSYRRALEWLIQNSIIATDNYFIEGRKCRGYKWHENHVAVRVEASEALSERIERRSRKTFRHYKRAHKHLLRWLGQVEIDSAAAAVFVASLPEDHHLRQPDTQQAILSTVALIHDREHEFAVCEYGRVHTPLTRLVKELRPFVTINGERLVNIDVANSQPLILGLLLLPPAVVLPSNNTSLPSAMIPSAPSDAPPVGLLVPPCAPCRPPPPNPTFLHSDMRPLETDVSEALAEQCDTSRRAGKRENSLQMKEQPDDIRLYVEFCQKGQLYEFLMAQVGLGNTPSARGRFKEQFYEQVLYGKGARMTRLAEAFRLAFPNVWRVIRRRKAHDYRRLARMMQRAESRLMIDTICHRLATELPDVPVVTIHDSIMTTPSHVETVTNLIAEEFGKLGLNACCLKVHGL